MFTDHETYPSLADVTGDFVYARLQQGQGRDPDRLSGQGDRRPGLAACKRGRKAKEPSDLPRVEPAHAAAQSAPRDVFAYVIHEGKIRAPAAAMALIERLKKASE